MSARLHVAFGESACGSLRVALRTAGRDDEAVFLADDYSLGPLHPDEERAAWLADAMGEEDWDSARDEKVWARLASSTGSVVAWMSSRDSSELCGYLELVRRRRAAIETLDVAEATFTSYHASTRSGFVRDDVIIAEGLFDRAVALDEITRARHLATWTRLREENAPLRVIEDGMLRSAPITHYDAAIVAATPAAWTTCARVVGDVVGDTRSAISDTFIWLRILQLMDDEVLEGENLADDDLWSMRTSRVRRPEKPPAAP